MWQFQQAACDNLLADHVVLNVFVISTIIFVPRKEKIIFLSLSGALMLAWAVAVVLQREAVQKLKDMHGKTRFTATW